MKQQTQYHIDVTPEEDQLFQENVTEEKLNPKPATQRAMFGKMFWIVFGAHVALVGALITTCSAMGSKPTVDLAKPVDELVGLPEVKQTVDDSAFVKGTERVEPQIQEVHTPVPKPVLAVPSPTPIAKNVVVKDKIVPNISSETSQTPVNKKIVDPTNLTKTYIVKEKDTIFSISKKYKLNTQKLLKINNIKDPNKIVVGQKLKFL